LPNVLSVASLNDDGGFSYFSNYGEEIVDIAAPGRSVISTLPENKTGPMTGTSMAAGVVTGAAAAVLSLTAPDSGADYDAETLRRQLLETADRLENLQNKVKDGRRLNLEQALYGETTDEILVLNPEDDFDVHGYQPTASEQFALYTGAGAVVQASAGVGHTLVLKENGTVWAWGDNTYGQLGDGTTTDRLTPVQVVGLTNITDISAGDHHNLAIDPNGDVWAWGRNAHGQLGDGGLTDSTVAQALGGTYATAIAAGGAHSLAIVESCLYGWGSNIYAQVAMEGSFRMGWGLEDIPYPSWIYDIPVDTIAAGRRQSAGLQGGLLSLWGYDENSVDGVGELRGVPSLSVAEAVELGESEHLALTSGGSVMAFDDNGSEEIEDLDNVIAIAKGDEFGIALKSDGTVWTWGVNNTGQLGHGNTTDTDTPAQITGLTNVVAIAAGDVHSVAVLSDGTVKTWGDNTYGQLGDGTTTTRLSPVSVTVSGASGAPATVAVMLTPSSVTIPTSGGVTTTATAVVRDGDDNILTGQTVTYSLVTLKTGVSVNSSTGVVTVSPTATAGTVTVRGTCGTVTGTATLTLTAVAPASLTVTLTPGSVTIPASGTVTATAAATVRDANNNVLTGQTVTYSLVTSKTGVSVNSSTGVVTVSSTATAGTVTIQGTCGSVTGTATLTLTASAVSMPLQATANKIYHVSVKGNAVSSFSGATYTITYDPSKLELQDFAAQTKQSTITPGAVTGTGLTIVSHSGGVLTFTVQKTISSGYKWSGVLTVLQFKALTTGSSSLQIA
jgi:hypothetical protein